MIGLYEISGGFSLSKRLLKSFDSFAWAEAYVRATYNIAVFDMDPDVPNAADFMTASGGIFSIEPVKLAQEAAR